jgi:F0F1-type ATP synthase epsilon subunit
MSVASVCCRVVSAEKDADGIEEVHRDTVKVTVGGEEPQHDPEMAKPGARLQRLKEELQQQIAQRRSEEWSRRLQEQRLDNEEEGERTTLWISFVKFV